MIKICFFFICACVGSALSYASPNVSQLPPFWQEEEPTECVFAWGEVTPLLGQETGKVNAAYDKIFNVLLQKLVKQFILVPQDLINDLRSLLNKTTVAEIKQAAQKTLSLISLNDQIYVDDGYIIIKHEGSPPTAKNKFYFVLPEIINVHVITSLQEQRFPNRIDQTSLNNSRLRRRLLPGIPIHRTAIINFLAEPGSHWRHDRNGNFHYYRIFQLFPRQLFSDHQSPQYIALTIHTQSQGDAKNLRIKMSMHALEEGTEKFLQYLEHASTDYKNSQATRDIFAKFRRSPSYSVTFRSVEDFESAFSDFLEAFRKNLIF